MLTVTTLDCRCRFIVEGQSVIATSCNLFSPEADISDMLSGFECGLLESDDPAVNLFFSSCHDDLESVLAEEVETDKELKVSCLLRLDDTFSVEDRWPI